MVQAAPAGIFTAFGGRVRLPAGGDAGRGGAERASWLSTPSPGAVITRFDNGGAGPGAIGIINGMAAVDYATPRVYFTSHENAAGSATTLWCLQLVAAPTVFGAAG